MCREHLVDFLFLLENKISSEHLLSFQRWLGYDNNFLVNPVGLSGGLALFWMASHGVDVRYSDSRLIDTKVSIGSVSYDMTFVYRDPVRQFRRAVWAKITNIGLNRDAAWFLAGDFNEIMNNSEKLGGPAKQESTFYPFRSLVRDCRIKEISSSGNRLSWAGRRGITLSSGEKELVCIQCKLDRAFGNAEWFHLFLKVRCEYLPGYGSDHWPLLITIAKSNAVRKGRFWFDKRWCSNPEIMALVKKGWNKHENDGDTSVMDRISDCRKELSRWKRGSDSNSKD